METQTPIDQNTILLTVTTPVMDGNGNPILDGSGNPVNNVTQTVLTLDEANQNLTDDTARTATYQRQLSEAQDAVTAAQASLDANTANLALDNTRLAAFPAVAPTNPTFTIQVPAQPNTASPVTL